MIRFILFIMRKVMPEAKSGLSNASTRDNWVYSELIKIPKGHRVLDAGAGECQYKKFCTHLNYVSQDFTQYDGLGNQQGFQTGIWDTSKIDIVSDISEIPEPDASFDAILCTEVFEHLPNPLDALNEFGRLLKPGGVLIITAPFVSMTHFAPYHYSTGFNSYFYEYHLPRYGFDNIKIIENGNYFEFMAQELRRLPSMAIDFAGSKKPLFLRFVIAILLLYLDQFSKKNNGSEKLLSFDLQVKSIKK